MTAYRPIGQKEDPPRTKNRRRVRVSCAVAHCVVARQLVTKGDDNLIDVYEDEIPELLDRMEQPKQTAEGVWESDTSRLEQAERWLAERKAEHEANGGRARDYNGPRTVGEAYRQLFPSKKGEPPNYPKPLRRIEVAAEVLPPPTSQDDQRARAHAEAMMGAAMTPLAKALDRLADRLDALEGNQHGNRGKGR